MVREPEVILGYCRRCGAELCSEDEDPEVKGLGFCSSCGAQWNYDR